jgi:OmpA family/PEGA domain
MRRIGWVLSLALAIALSATAGFAQDGKIKIKVTPSQGYIFVDGKALREGSRTISVSPGKHTIVIVNYGYKLETREVDVTSGKTTDVTVALQSYGGNQSGPWGAVKFVDGDRRAAVLSNGKTPAFFVGHVDEFDWDWIWKQELLLPPGAHHLVVTRNGNTIWEGDVNIVANQKVVVDLGKNGAQTTKKWDRGTKLHDIPRFKAGIASTTVAVAPVSGSFSSSSSQINCGQSANLTWQTAETVDANISNVGAVDPSGSKSVSPHATTTYDFTAAGPGGTVKGSATVNVNTKVDATLTANPTDVTYRQIGDKVISPGTSTLTWTTSNAQSATLDGSNVDVNGSQTVTAKPSDTTPPAEGQPPRTGDETKNYTLNATNVCGGSASPTASLHLAYSIEPIPQVLLQSIFYPTDYPDKHHPQVGLVKSQQLVVASLAAGFKKYLEYDPDAKLSIEAFADIRGGKAYNQDLSERRVERIKQFLVDQGVAADKVQTAAYGKERPLDKKVVKGLEETNPNKPPKAREKNVQADWLAYNRRADIVLLPSGKKSSQFFPHSADDSGIIWQVPKPSLKKVETK